MQATSANSTDGRRLRGAEPSSFSVRMTMLRSRSRCSPRTMRRWKMRARIRCLTSACGSTKCRCASRVNGVPAGLDASFGVSSGSMISGADCCRKAARARAGISFCKPSRSIDSSILGASGACTAIGLSTARWPTCSAAIFPSPTRIGPTNATTKSSPTNAHFSITSRSVGRRSLPQNTKVLLCDLTSTYFESEPPETQGGLRRFGYSRDQRSDCVQIVIALIVTPEGYPIACEVLPGNTTDKTTLKSLPHRHAQRKTHRAGSKTARLQMAARPDQSPRQTPRPERRHLRVSREPGPHPK